MAEETFERSVREKLAELYTGEGKNHVETEIVLPDYKEEVHRVFRVDARPRIQQKNVYIQGKHLVCEIDGVSTIQVLYQSERQGESGVPTSFSSQENFSFADGIKIGNQVANGGFASATGTNQGIGFSLFYLKVNSMEYVGAVVI